MHCQPRYYQASCAIPKWLIELTMVHYDYEIRYFWRQKKLLASTRADVITLEYINSPQSSSGLPVLNSEYCFFLRLFSFSFDSASRGIDTQQKFL